MRTILHITRMNFLSNKAHVYTTTKTCEALAMQEGVQVTLLSSDNSLMDKGAQNDFFKKHSVSTVFDIVSLPSFSRFFKGSKIRLFNWLETIAVNISIAYYIFFHHKSFDILYYRDATLILPILLTKYILRKPLFIEVHAVLHKKHGQFLNDVCARISNGVIAISHGLKDYYQKINNNIVVAFCAAAEIDRFNSISESKIQLRDLLGLPQDKTILIYSGNLSVTGNNDSYGIEDIISAMPYIDSDIIFIGVGKKGNETKKHEELSRSLGVDHRIVFLPWVSKQEVYRFWKAGDVLMLPAAGAQIGNSPTKMFEYLATGKGIVSARTKPIEEVLVHERNALLVSDYKNPRAWADAINMLLKDANLSEKLISHALKDSVHYTWEKRGEHIIQFILKTI